MRLCPTTLPSKYLACCTEPQRGPLRSEPLYSLSLRSPGICGGPQSPPVTLFAGVQPPGVPSPDPLQPLQRLGDLLQLQHRLLALLPVGFHDVLVGIGKELRIAELGVDALDLGLGSRPGLFE